MPEEASASTSASVRNVQWSAEAAPSSTASRTPGPGPSWLAWIRGSRPRARPAVSTARASSAPNAPRSQNTSTQRECGAHASSIGPHTRSTYRAESPSNSAGTTCAPRYVTSGVTSAASATERASSATVSPYPDLHSNVVVPCRSISPASRRSPARSSASVAARVAATVDLMPPAWYGRPGHPGRELGGPLPREHQVRVRVDEPGQHRAPGRVDHRVGGGRPRRRAGPGDPVPLDDQRRVVDRGEPARPPASRRRARSSPARRSW